MEKQNESLKNRRRILIVNKFQYRLITIIMGLIISISIILIVALFLIFKYGIIGPPGPLPQLFKPVLLIVLIALILYLVSLRIVILLSNRIYGPIYRLSNYIQRLSKGERTGELKFRNGDMVNGLKEIYNLLHQSLEKTLHYDYQELAKVFPELENILDKIYNKKIAENDLYNSLQDICNRLAKILDITSKRIKA